MKIISDKENLYFLDGEIQGSFYFANKVTQYSPGYISVGYYGKEKPIKKEPDLWEKGYLFYIQYSSYDIFGDKKIKHYKKYGYALDSGEVIIPPRYDELMFWGFGFKARKYIDNISEIIKVECLFDKFGNFVLPDYISKELVLTKKTSLKDIHLIGTFSYGFAIFCSYNKIGVLNKNLEIVIPAQYCYVNKTGFGHGQFIFNTYDGEYRGTIELGYIEQNGLKRGDTVKKKYALVRGNKIVNYIEGVTDAYCLNNGLGYKVFKDKEQGLYDINGNVLIPCALQNLSDVGKNIYLKKKDNKLQLLRFENNILKAKSEFDFDFEFISSDQWDENPYGAKICVKVENEYLILNEDFKVIDKIKNLDLEYHPEVKTYGQGLIGCYRTFGSGEYTSYRYYFFNTNGELIIPNKENDIPLRSIESCFNENRLAKVELYDRDSRGSLNYDGYYNAIIDITGKVKEYDWISCDLRDPSWRREDYNDNSDAFEGDPEAYWNID